MLTVFETSEAEMGASMEVLRISRICVDLLKKHLDEGQISASPEEIEDIRRALDHWACTARFVPMLGNVSPEDHSPSFNKRVLTPEIASQLADYIDGFNKWPSHWGVSGWGPEGENPDPFAFCARLVGDGVSARSPEGFGHTFHELLWHGALEDALTQHGVEWRESPEPNTGPLLAITVDVLRGIAASDE